MQVGFDPESTETLRWHRRAGVWLLCAAVTFLGSLQLWIASGVVLCGSDTTEPMLSESVCHGGGLAIGLLIAVPFTPFLVVFIGGPLALKRRSGRLFRWSVYAPPTLLGVALLGLLLGSDPGPKQIPQQLGSGWALVFACVLLAVACLVAVRSGGGRRG